MRYIRPETIEQATAEIAKGGTPLAGGTVLVPEIKRVRGEDLTLVDIGRIDALRELKAIDGCLYIGATVTLARIFANAELKDKSAAIVRAAEAVGNPQVRRAATIGGNLALGIPGADLPPALLVLEAEAVLMDQDGESCHPIAQMIEAGVPAGHLIAAIKVPIEVGRRSGFLKFAWRRASGKTIVNVAAALRIEDGLVVAPRLAVGGLGSHATRLPRSEKILDGQVWNESLAEEAARLAASEAVFDVPSPPGEKYRRKLVAAGIRQLLKDMAKS
jgi:CO/xanthine dehydrogenase FAD-binding subunit